MTKDIAVLCAFNLIELSHLLSCWEETLGIRGFFFLEANISLSHPNDSPQQIKHLLCNVSLKGGVGMVTNLGNKVTLGNFLGNKLV